MTQIATEQLFYTRGNQTILLDLNLLFSQGIYGILGQNGAGKSTLLKLLSGTLTPTTGRILINDTPLVEISRLRLSQLAAVVPQAPTIPFNFTVEEFVLMGLYPHKDVRASSAEKHDCTDKSLAEVDGLHLRKRRITGLSAGERQRIYLARALMADAPILLLDEPTSSLDISHQLHIWELLQGLKAKGKLILIALHDLHAAERFCDQLVLLHRGTVAALGPYSKISPLVHQVFNVLPSPAHQAIGFQRNDGSIRR